MTSPATHFKSWEDAVRWLREQPDRQSLVHSAYYDDPLEEAARRYWLSEEWQAVRQFLPEGGTALDVGAGRGIASYALARDGFAVTALEPDPSALVGAQAIRQLACDAGLHIEVTQEFSERLPYEDGSFDVVFARAVLHHTRDLSAACGEFRRVLKRGGRLIAIREHVISRPEDLPAFFEIHPLHKLYGGENALLLSEYVRALQSAGLEQLQIVEPMESALNLAPHTLGSFQRELASRIVGPLSLLASPVAALLSMAPVWRLALPLLRRADHRPGRLYSFIAVKP